MDHFSGLALVALGLFVLYLVVRLAVHHGIRDAWRSRERDSAAAG